MVGDEQVYLVFSCAAVNCDYWDEWLTSSIGGVGFGEFLLDSGERFLETVVLVIDPFWHVKRCCRFLVARLQLLNSVSKYQIQSVLMFGMVKWGKTVVQMPVI